MYFSQRKSNNPPFTPPAMPPHKPMRQHEHPLHKLTRMSAHRTLVVILNILLRMIQERINTNDICILDGHIVDLGCVRRKDRREVDSARSQYIDFNAAAVGVPAGKTAHSDLVRRFTLSGGLQEVSAVRVDYGFFDTLGIGIKVVD